jgi:hypothetical protein
MNKITKSLRLAALLFLVDLAGISDTYGATALQNSVWEKYELEFAGFMESRQGWRLQDNPLEKNTSISETRLQIDLGSDFGWSILKIKGDLLGDLVEETSSIDLRDLNLMFSPMDFIDMKIGRQTLTWGTGDLLFINDFFAKDWKSFFIGRDDEYLKAPSDAVKTSLFFDFLNIDLVYIPLFSGSEYIDGNRLSYWNGHTIAGNNSIFQVDSRNSIFKESEFSIRASKDLDGIEISFYGYSGFWQTPEGINSQTGKGFFPRMSVYGASIRGALFGGIGNMETGFYDSREDRDGNNPFIRNSELRFLTGFERELAQDFTGAIQYYIENMQNYENYTRTLPPGSPAKDEVRHVGTVRLTRFLMNQNLKLSLFIYYSPSDNDLYARPKINYKVNDQWAVEAGINFFYGDDVHTFFGQFEDNTNAYGSVRYNF